MKWTIINHQDIPEETVIAIYAGEEPVIGTLKVKNGNAYCVLPYMNTDDGSYYEEMVTHFISLHDFDHAIEEPW